MVFIHLACTLPPCLHPTCLHPWHSCTTKLWMWSIFELFLEQAINCWQYDWTRPMDKQKTLFCTKVVIFTFLFCMFYQVPQTWHTAPTFGDLPTDFAQTLVTMGWKQEEQSTMQLKKSLKSWITSWPWVKAWRRKWNHNERSKHWG